MERFRRPEKALIERGKGKIIINEVNTALRSGKAVDANTYFEAITEWEDGRKFDQWDWPSEDAFLESQVYLGQSTIPKGSRLSNSRSSNRAKRELESQ